MDHNAPVVAVDRHLTPYRDALAAAGFVVVPADGSLRADVAAVVVDGMDDQLLGEASDTPSAPVINAAGRTAAEVVDAVRARLRRADDRP
jgi:hypothetical protein